MTQSTAHSSPEVAGRGAELRLPGSVLRRVSSASASTVIQSGACSSLVPSGCDSELRLSASTSKVDSRN